MEYESYSHEQTEDIGYNIGKTATPGNVYCLFGDLGVGKTVFVKGFARGLNINTDITSPTFTIINEYTQGHLPLYHFDVYRINSIDEMDDTGYEDYFYSQGVCIIEWAQLIENIIPDFSINIYIEKDYEKDGNYRKIKVGEL